MNLQEHASREDMKVWLSQDEIAELIGAVEDDPNKRIAFGLAVYSGLRSEEITEVRPLDVRETDAGPMVIIHDGKGGKYRETPIPNGLKTTIHTAAEYRAEPETHPIVTSTSEQPGVTTRTLRRWIEATRDELAEDTGEDRWRHLTMHDLRRTWATQLRSADVDAMLVCDWGGWQDLETFMDAYKGKFTPESQLREREKVDWL